MAATGLLSHRKKVETLLLLIWGTFIMLLSSSWSLSIVLYIKLIFFDAHSSHFSCALLEQFPLKQETNES